MNKLTIENTPACSNIEIGTLLRSDDGEIWIVTKISGQFVAINIGTGEYWRCPSDDVSETTKGLDKIPSGSRIVIDVV